MADKPKPRTVTLTHPKLPGRRKVVPNKAGVLRAFARSGWLTPDEAKPAPKADTKT